MFRTKVNPETAIVNGRLVTSKQKGSDNLSGNLEFGWAKLHKMMFVDIFVSCSIRKPTNPFDLELMERNIGIMLRWVIL